MLKKHAFNYLQGDIIAKAMSFIGLLIIGSLASKEDIGIYNLILFAAELTAIFILFGADSAIVKFYQDHSASEVLNSYIFQNIVNVFLVSVALYLFSITFREGVYRFVSDYFGIILLIAITFAATTITRAHLAALGESAKIKWLAIISSALNLLSIIFLAFTFGLSLFPLVFSKVIGGLIFLVFLGQIYFSLYEHNKINKELTKNMYRFSVPLLISTIVGTLSAYLSRIVLAEYVSMYELGVFSFFIMIMMNTSFLLHSFNQAWFPYLLKTYGSENEEIALMVINKKITGMLRVGFIWAFISIFIFNVTNNFSFDLNGYYKYRYIAIILLDSLIFGGLYIIINPLIYILSKTEHVAHSSLIILIFNIIITVILVKLWGIFGAAVSVVCISLVSFLIYWFFSQKYIKGRLINLSSVKLIAGLNILIIVKYLYIYKILFMD